MYSCKCICRNTKCVPFRNGHETKGQGDGQAEDGFSFRLAPNLLLPAVSHEVPSLVALRSLAARAGGQVLRAFWRGVVRSGTLRESRVEVPEPVPDDFLPRDDCHRSLPKIAIATFNDGHLNQASIFAVLARARA